jgi:hypothetical protein
MKHPVVAAVLIALAGCVPPPPAPLPPPQFPPPFQPPPAPFVRPAPEPNLGPVVQGSRDFTPPPTRCPPGYKWRAKHRAVGPGGTSQVIPARCVPKSR